MSTLCNVWRAHARRRCCAPVATVLLALAFGACGEAVVDPGDEPEEQILFLSTRVGGTDQFGRPLRDIYRMNVSGTGIESVTRQPAWGYWHLSLSPEGSRIAFISSLDCDISVMKTDGTDLTRLTNLSGGSDDGCNTWPRWSPDGAQVAFASNREGRTYQRVGGLYDGYVMNADGSSPRNVSHLLSDGTGMMVAVIGWSPGGQIVLETSTFVDGLEYIVVYVVNADGSAPRPLFATPGDHSPAWSPDGSQIVFISERDGRRRLYIMNADGSGERALTSHVGNDWLPGHRGGTATAFAYSPWSPDGTRIAFDRDALDEWGTYVINADGSGLRRLSDHPTWFNGWSSDGTRLAFTRRRIPTDVYVVDADGSNLRNLTGSPHSDSDALWLPHE